MRIINIMINMMDITQERSDRGPTLKLNRRVKWHTRQGIYGFAGLEKIKSIAFLEVNAFSRKPLSGVKK